MPTLQLYKGYPLWEYIPNLPAACVFAALFGLMTILHIGLAFKNRLWFCIPFIVGGLFEVVGYIGRILAYNETGELIPYIMQSVTLLLAPVFFAASLYMTLTRVIVAVDAESCSLFRTKWLTAIFVTSDVISFFIQAGGAGILAQGASGSKVKLGQHIIVAGLVFQLLAFGVFIVTAVIFNARYRSLGQAREAHRHSHVPWQSILVMLYVTSAAIMIRNVLRAAEYSMGQTGYLLNHEWPIYVFDAALMLLTMVAFAWKYPSQLLRTKATDDNLEMGKASLL